MNRSKDSKLKDANVFSYARWSSDGQSDGDSSRRQDETARQWCVRQGLELTSSEQDAGVSAWKGKNRREGSGLSRLLKVLKPGDYLLVEDIDRLSREDWLTAMDFVRDIVATGATLVTLNNGNPLIMHAPKPLMWQFILELKYKPFLPVMANRTDDKANQFVTSSLARPAGERKSRGGILKGYYSLARATGRRWRSSMGGTASP